MSNLIHSGHFMTFLSISVLWPTFTFARWWVSMFGTGNTHWWYKLLCIRFFFLLISNFQCCSSESSCPIIWFALLLLSISVSILPTSVIIIPKYLNCATCFMALLCIFIFRVCLSFQSPWPQFYLSSLSCYLFHILLSRNVKFFCRLISLSAIKAWYSEN